MKVILVSDTHGMHTNLREVFEREKPFEQVLHMGDTALKYDEIEKLAGVPVAFVAGNCDWGSSQPTEKVVIIGGTRIFMAHGHTYHVNYGYEYIAAEARKRNALVCLFGHTHVPCFETNGGIYLVNPGSISSPRQGGGIPTYGVMYIEQGKEPVIELKYLD